MLPRSALCGSLLSPLRGRVRVRGFFHLGEMPVRGHAPVRAFEVRQPRGRRMCFDVAVERGLTPLVGRERELGLRAAPRPLQRGQGWAGPGGVHRERAAADMYDGAIESWNQSNRCFAHIGLGEYAEALTAINDGLTKARDRDNPFILGRLTNTLGWLTRNWAISSAPSSTTATVLTLASVSGIPTSRSAL